MKKINWRYAIGELLIVTAGITLAFALNSFSEERKEADKRSTYLSGIRADLEDDIAALDSTTGEINARLKILYSIIPYMRGKVAGRDSAMTRFFTVIDPVKFRSHQSTLQSLRFSGDLRLIDNLELRTRIVAHYDAYSSVDDEYERHVTFSREFVADYFMENMDYMNLASADMRLFEDRYFRNLVFSLIGIYQMNLQRQEEALQRAKSVDEAIEEEMT